MSTFYLCSIDGYHPDNSARWCGCGCGSDYNRMIPTDTAGALEAADDKIRFLERTRTRAVGDLYRARKERQAVLDCINLYGDRTLHDALDAAGLLRGDTTHGYPERAVGREPQ